MTTRVVVLGAGCFGLASAIELLKAGYEVTIVSERRTPNTTSDGAGALWRPQIEKANHQWATFDQWGQFTLKKLAALNRSYNAEETGIMWVNGIEFHNQQLPVPRFSEHVIGFHEMRESELALMGLKRAKFGFQFTSIIADMTIYLPFLEREFVHSGGKFIDGTIKSFEGPQYSDQTEVNTCMDQADLIVNCLGLAPMTLLNDKEMKPIRGYLVRVTCPSVHHWYRESESWSYIFPRRNEIVLGGTYDIGETDCTENNELAQSIIDKCCDIVPELKHAKLVNHWVGLRPHRNTLRLEMEMPIDSSSSSSSEPRIIPCPTSVECYGHDSPHINNTLKNVDCARSRVPIIHNYGAGGSGMTLHWGCAVDVLQLAKRVRPPQIDRTTVSPEQHDFNVKPQLDTKLVII